MKKIVAGLIGMCFAVGLAFAAEPQFRDGIPERYTVKEGDTLWAISSLFLNDPLKWPEVWSANPQIKNPDLIYPGDVIVLVYVDGQPRLVLERNGVSSLVATGSNGNGGVTPMGGRNVKLSPQIGVSPHEEAIPAIPLDAINNFLARTRIVDPGTEEIPSVLDTAPYVLAGHERKLMSGEGDDFYVRGALIEGVDFYGIYRKGRLYVDPQSEEILGVKAEDIGSGQLKEVNGDIATFLTTRSTRELRVGDRLLPHEERRLEPTFFPTAPKTDIAGKIIDVEGGVSQVGTLDVVAINQGEREGLEIGNVLAIYKAGETIVDRVAGEKIILPSERAGLLMVFRTFEKMSFGLVLNADRPLAIKDEVRTPK